MQRVVMQKKLEHMGVELREMLVYQSPPELGALYTDVSAMMEKITAEQTIAIAKKMRDEEAREKRRKQMIEKYWLEGAAILGIIVMIGFFIATMAWVVQNRIEKYPHLGNGWIPKTEKQRREEAEPKVYIGR